MKILFFLVALSVLGGAVSQTINGTFPECDGHTVNPYPAYYNSTLVPIKTVPNGKLFMYGPPGNQIRLVSLTGNYYEMGFAHGLLLREEIGPLFAEFIEYIYQQIAPIADKLPKVFQDLLKTAGIKAVLDLTYAWTEPFTPQRFKDEMRGLADGSGLSYAMIAQVHMIPELIQAACSMLGAWGSASATGTLLQLRALDWGTDAPLRNYPAWIQYNPVGVLGAHPSGILSWSGFVGALTGYSSAGLAVSEKVWYAYQGILHYEQNRKGIPWHFLMRDIITFDLTLEAALDRIYSATRTCAIWMGIGSHWDNRFNAVGYSYEYLPVFNDTTPFPLYAPTPAAHPLMDGVVYIDKHVQPSDNPCFGNLIKATHGTITARTIIDMLHYTQSGDLHSAVSDFAADMVHVSVCGRGAWPGGNVSPAYLNQFISINITALLNA